MKKMMMLVCLSLGSLNLFAGERVPNLISCSNKQQGIHLGLSLSSIMGKPTFSYKRNDQVELSAIGRNQIEFTKNELGTLVTVKGSADQELENVKFVLPDVRISEGQGSVSFASMIAEKYEADELGPKTFTLSCHGSFVYF